MKRSLLIHILLFTTLLVKADVIFFPYQYSGINYSLELIYEYEIVKSPHISVAWWGGTGVVGSFFFLDEPTFGIEAAFEYRRYFRPEAYRNFFFSAYIGTAFMSNLNGRYDLGLVPGIKINHKTYLTNFIVLEPYLGLAIPVSYSLDNTSLYIPFPMATIGIRMGICNLNK